MKNSLKILSIAASITLAGCASTPYNAGQYALENQRLTSETSLNAVEPDEQFSDAMQIMYDYSQVDIDYKNNLDEPYIKGKSLTKDVLSLGGTASLIANGAALADIGSFFFATNYEKNSHFMYTKNTVLRFVDVSDLQKPSEIEDLIKINRDDLATTVQRAYAKSGISFTSLDSTQLDPKATKFWGDSSNYIIPLNKEDNAKNYSRLCEVNVQENINSLRDIGFVRNDECQVRVWQRIELTKNDNNLPIAAFKGKKVRKYLIITAFLPSDFPMGKLSSQHEYDYAYTPAFSWLSNPSKFAQSYGEAEMDKKLKNNDVSMLPKLVNLFDNKEVEFSYQRLIK